MTKEESGDAAVTVVVCPFQATVHFCQPAAFVSPGTAPVAIDGSCRGLLEDYQLLLLQSFWAWARNGISLVRQSGHGNCTL